MWCDQRGVWYRAVWRDGRPTHEHVGRGRVAELIARLDDLEIEQRELARLEEREQLRAAQAEQRHLEEQLAPADELARLVERAALLCAGYRQHLRGEWRRRRA